MKINIIIQARCSSLRLPYKSLMPIKGMPLILLIAKRIKKKNFNIIVATSNHESDNDLCKLLKRNKIKYFRGELNNVYKRIYDCLNLLKNNHLTLRLTGDNPFIDHRIISKIVDELVSNKKKYNYIDNINSKVPYGISVEAFEQKFFKNLKVKNNFEKEHVTVSARTKKNNNYKSELVFFNNMYSNLRCTVDNLDDYILINNIFLKVNNPIKISWYDLCKKLMKYKRIKNLSLECKKKIILGTAQLGTKYGVNNFYEINKKKIERFANRKKILYCAAKLGIKKIDTARKYKNSEKIIGSYNKLNKQKFEVDTKIASIKPYNKHFFNNIKNSINLSLKFLGKKNINYLYFHNYQNLKSISKKDLKFIKNISYCRNLGVSIYNPGELDNLIQNKYLKVFQIPFSILDSRFKKYFNILKKNNKKIIIRSIFMQGLIFSNKWPAKIQAFRKKILNKINFFTDKFKRINSLDLFLSYVNYHKKIDGLIIGIDNKSQLFQIFSFLDSKPLNSMQVKEIDKFFNKIPRIVYDVRGWNL